MLVKVSIIMLCGFVFFFCQGNISFIRSTIYIYVCLFVCLSVYHFLNFRIEANQANSQTLCYTKEEKKCFLICPWTDSDSNKEHTVLKMFEITKLIAVSFNL